MEGEHQWEEEVGKTNPKTGHPPHAVGRGARHPTSPRHGGLTFDLGPHLVGAILLFCLEIFFFCLKKLSTKMGLSTKLIMQTK